MQRRRRRCINPKDDARCRGIFTSIPFQTGDFLIEYRGELISQQECETRLKRYPARLKGFMFEFHFDGKLWWCGLDEVMPLETCGATQAQSQNENFEEMVTNSDCTETTESYTKTTGQVFSPLSRAEKHCLRIASVSSLERCVSCVGPVSSSKWLGYECRECSQVWHKSCFRNIQDDNLHYLPKPSENSFRDELQSNQSDSEKDQISDECMSGEEYIPDSHGDDDDYSDASIPLMPSQSKAGQIQFKTLTDVGKNYPSDTSLPVLPSTSRIGPLLIWLSMLQHLSIDF
ncbi:hypothetical protein F7725_021081 [Dissostichus mawsoni]|uniref:Phorbol-ester/DAG-type domain-containing protein n=1 Tax=Dissostichus mawsoni TaxID=36200 RepID=A0A7J5YFX1_DISMA|nr:hypothetical protein F7725_021081 [Dissostichus mawsoni]